MRTWAWLLSGLIIWTVHFFGAYVIASLFPGTGLARWLVGFLTAICIGAAGLILALMVRRRRLRRDALDRWMFALVGAGQVLAIVAMAYQGLPALIA